MEKVEALPQETTYKIGNRNYNISRVFKGEKPLKNVIVETITSEKSQSHNWSKLLLVLYLCYRNNNIVQPTRRK